MDLRSFPTRRSSGLKGEIGEQRDLAASEPAKAAELRDMLHAWREKVGARMQQPNPDYQSPAR